MGRQTMRSGTRSRKVVLTQGPQGPMPPKFRFTALIHREGDGYVALCPELDIASQGDTIEEARKNLEEAVGLFIETADITEFRERLLSDTYVTQIEV